MELLADCLHPDPCPSSTKHRPISKLVAFLYPVIRCDRNPATAPKEGCSASLGFSGLLRVRPLGRPEGRNRQRSMPHPRSISSALAAATRILVLTLPVLERRYNRKKDRTDGKGCRRRDVPLISVRPYIRRRRTCSQVVQDTRPSSTLLYVK